MQDALLSPYWYRIAALHPRLRGHVSVRMQRTRGQAWYVLHNQATGRYHRVNAQAFELVGRLDGRFSVDQIWQALLNKLGDEAPTQNDVIRIMGQLTDAGLVQAETTPDVRQMMAKDEERGRREKRAKLNPLSFRLSLFNPSALLEHLYPRVRPLLTPAMLLIWLMLASTAALAAAGNWVQIRNYAALHFLTPSFLAISWVVYPLMKGLHELGHAVVLRRFGCEVPEVGVNFFLFVPMPYVDASAANRLSSRLQRALISSAGILVELGLAALGVAIWLSVEDGFVREAAFTVMTIGGLSTLVFNGNPLMKFDGYFVACDVLDLPNLAQRSSRYNERMWQRLVGWLLRMPSDSHEQVDSDVLERWALRLYTPLAWLWRLLVSGFMVTWAADKSSWLGMAILAWMLWSLLLQPCKQWVDNLVMTPGFESARGRATWVGTVAIVALLLGLAMVPVPAFVVADGVVWLPDEALVRAGADGRVDALLVQSGQRVTRGQPLMQIKDAGLQARLEVIEARIEASRAELNAAIGTDALKVSNAQQALERDRAEMTQVQEDLAHLTLRAARSGEFVLSRQEDIDQKEVSRGQLLAYVLSDEHSTVRVLVSQRDIDDVRAHLKDVSVVLQERPGLPLPARTSGDTPAAVERLPVQALSNKFGGPIPVDASEADGLKPTEPMFVLDVMLDRRLPRAGGLAKVRLDLTPRPLLQTWALRWKQLFLRHFSDVGSSA